MIRKSTTAGLMALALISASMPATAEDRDQARADYIRANYTKFEYRIPVRDGTRLFTAVYVPNDVSQDHPILLFRTPYNVKPYGADRYKATLGPSAKFEQEGFIFVFQDVRGRYMSEGEFINMRPHQATGVAGRPSGTTDAGRPSGATETTAVDESTDTYDTIEWLLQNVDNHNGRVGQWGISYPGFYTAAGMIDSHPALKAASPQAPIADWFWDDMHHHGAFILPLAFNFFSTFGQPRPEPTTERPERFDHGTADGYQFFLDLGPLGNVDERHFKGEIEFWNQITAHPNYDDFWQSRNLLPHLKNVSAAVMTVGGWFDTEDLYGPLKIYREVERNNPGIDNTLVMGPWSHGGWNRTHGDSLGRVSFGFDTSKGYQNDVVLPFFRHFLKGGEEFRLPEAYVFETGANRWRSFDAWPPKARRERKLYLHAGGGLSFDPPETTGEAFDDYVSDPAKPVPYTMEITTRWAKEYMTEDQRYAAWRPDVLVYRSAVLEDDLTLAGPLAADLFVSTSGTASDWIVKLIDVFPDQVPKDQDDEREDSDSPEAKAKRAMGGYQMLVRWEVLRGRFRDSYQHPAPFVAGEVTPVAFELQDVLHTFKRGHRLMIQIHSTWFPFVDRNPQKYVPNIFEANGDDFIKVTNRVYRSRQHPSGIEIGVID